MKIVFTGGSGRFGKIFKEKTKLKNVLYPKRYQLDITNLNNISELCENLLIKNNISIDSIEAFEKKYFSNLNNSASYAAKYLINKSKLEM